MNEQFLALERVVVKLNNQVAHWEELLELANEQHNITLVLSIQARLCGLFFSIKAIREEQLEVSKT